jgi:uncharacterized protein
MSTWLTAPWPWYLAGPIIGLFVPALLLAGNKVFGISSNLRHLCSFLLPGRLEYLRYDWKNVGLWNLVFLFGVLIGGVLAAHSGAPHDIAISSTTKAALTQLGLHDLSGVAPHEIFSWQALLTCVDLCPSSWEDSWLGSAPRMREDALQGTQSPVLRISNCPR